jgi:long-chain fatty acid transport protein
MLKIMRFGVLSLMALLLAAMTARAGGLYLYEIGSPDVGLAAAGYAARAQDASTAFTNPAGMTRINQPSVMAGAQPMYLNIDFSADSNTTVTGGNGDSNGWMPAGGLFYVQPVGDRLALGLAMTGYFGLALNYQNDWVGRYYVQNTTMQAAAIQPAIAWKANDHFSLGAGVAVLYGMFEDKLAINRSLDALADGQLKLEDEDWAAQLNLGALYEPIQGTRIGLTYLSKADLDFSDQADVSGFGDSLTGILGLGSRDIDLGITMPQAVMFSAYHELHEGLALLANVGWQDWSEFGKVDVAVTDTLIDLTTDLDYQDTWHGALGIQYRISEPLMLTTGMAYDSAMMDEEDLGPSLPVGEQWRFALGGLYDWSQDLTLGAAYELVWTGDLDMDVERGPLAGRVSGTYENEAIHVVSLNAAWRF